MAEIQIQPSQRFTRAALAERNRLERQRQRLLERRMTLQAKLDDLDEQIEATGQQLDSLETFAVPRHGAADIWVPSSVDAEGEMLRGSMIRAVAVPLLIQKHGLGPIHYRDWYALLTQEGYAVAGKRPDAVFLNQVSRSPLVRSTTKSGYYVVETGITAHLQEQLRRLQSQLANALQEAPTDGSSLEANRKRQQELNTAIRRTERELQEALSTLDSAHGGSTPAVEPDAQPEVRAA